MKSVKISTKFRVVIPKKIRNALNLQIGQKVEVIQYRNRIELIPKHSVSEMKGFLKGINTEIKRGDDRF